MKKQNNGKLRIIPLGGLEQIGMNITVFEYEDSIIVVDCGLAFPEDDMLGIDLVIPDVTYLKDNISKVKGFVITHGHEDHIGRSIICFVERRERLYVTVSQSILESSGLNLSRRTTVSRMRPHWQSIHRQVLLSTQETSRLIILRYLEMRSTCSVLLRSVRKACWH